MGLAADPSLLVGCHLPQPWGVPPRLAASKPLPMSCLCRRRALPDGRSPQADPEPAGGDGECPSPGMLGSLPGHGLCWCCGRAKWFSMSCPGDTSPSEVDLLSCKGSGLLGHLLLLGPLLSACLSLAAVSLRSVQTLSPACPSAPQCHPLLPGQGLPALTKEPCFFFLPAAQVLPQRAPDAAGAEGGAGLPVPECELRTRVVRQHKRWLGHLRVSHSCCPAPRLGTVVPRHCSCPWLQMGSQPSHTSPHAEQYFPQCQTIAAPVCSPGRGESASPKGRGGLLASATPRQQELRPRQGFGFGCSELSPVASRLR